MSLDAAPAASAAAGPAAQPQQPHGDWGAFARAGSGGHSNGGSFGGEAEAPWAEFQSGATGELLESRAAAGRGCRHISELCTLRHLSAATGTLRRHLFGFD